VTILIDPPLWPAHGRRWSHLVSDVSFEELHAFAGALGVPERGFEGDHYDVPEERYPVAVRAGAVPVSSRELLDRLRAAGLRRRKRRGERVLAGRTEPDGVRRDAVLSALPPAVPPRSWILAWHRPGRLYAVRRPGRIALPRRGSAPPDGVQLGYLRWVEPTAGATLAIEVLWRRPAPDETPDEALGATGDGAPAPGGGRWLRIAEVVAGTDPVLAALLSHLERRAPT
jgi:hypothetical protein